MATIGKRYPVPGAGISNAEAKRRLKDRGKYAATRNSRLIGNWNPADQSINDILRGDNPVILARVKQLVRDFPPFKRASDAIKNFYVGDGMKFQARVLNPLWTEGSAESRFDRKINREIEAVITAWHDESDYQGIMCFGEMERLAIADEQVLGEFYALKRLDREDRNRFLPFALQMYAPEWLTDNGAKPLGTNMVDQGVEFTKQGKIVATHLADPTDMQTFRGGATSRIVKADSLRGYEVLEGGQLRGVSAFVVGVLAAQSLGDYIGATMDTAKMAAKYLAFIKTPDPAGRQKLILQDGVENPYEDLEQIEEMENAIIEYLRPNEEAELAAPNTVSDMFDPVTKFILRFVAISTNTPYSILTGDYNGLNYTVSRTERQDYTKMRRPGQTRLVKNFSAPATWEALDWAVLAGRIDLPGYELNPWRYRRGIFLPPGDAPIDPLKEAKANADNIDNGLDSQIRILAAKGLDAEEVLDELAEFQAMAAEKGVELGDTDTPLAGNPASIMRMVENVLDRQEMLKDED
jgi:lambda family phage portal protein